MNAENGEAALFHKAFISHAQSSILILQAYLKMSYAFHKSAELISDVTNIIVTVLK